MMGSSSFFHNLRKLSSGSAISKTCHISSNPSIQVMKNETSYTLVPSNMQDNNETILVRACDCLSTVEAYCSEATTSCEITRDNDYSDIQIHCYEEHQYFLRYLFAFIFIAICSIFVTCMRSPKGHTILRFVRRSLFRCCKTRHDRILNSDLRELERDYIQRQNIAMIQLRAQTLQRHRNQNPFDDMEAPLALNILRLSRNSVATTRQVSALLKTKKYEATEGDYVCPVCLVEVEDGDRVGDLPCGHTYHVECLKAWLQRKNICPLCKKEGLASTEEGPQIASRD